MSDTKKLVESIQNNLNEDVITSKGNFNLVGDNKGYHIYNKDKLEKDLGMIKREEALVNFDEYLKDLDESEELKEDTVDNVQAYENLMTMQNTIQSKTGCTVNIEGGNLEKPTVYIKGNSQQLANCLQYVDAVIDLFKEWGNEAYATYNKDSFIISIK